MTSASTPVRERIDALNPSEWVLEETADTEKMADAEKTADALFNMCGTKWQPGTMNAWQQSEKMTARRSRRGRGSAN